MEIINLRIIHPTNNSDIDIGLPDAMRVKDIFSQLVDANFLCSGQPYKGILKSSLNRKYDIPLDRNKTVSENGVENNDVIQIFIADWDGLDIDNEDYFRETATIPGNIVLRIIHPTNNSDIEIGVPVIITLGDVIKQLVEANFLSPGQPYSAVLKPKGRRTESVSLDNNKTISENGIEDKSIIQMLCATQAGGFDILELWNTFYPYLDQIGTVLGIVGSTIGFGIWTKKRFSKEYTPKQFTEKITDKEFWNYHELALKLGVSDEEAKMLLKGFGYTWNRYFSLYRKTDRTAEIIAKVKNDII